MTEEETEEALRIAREAKFYYLKRVSYMEKLNGPREIKKYTAEEIKDFLKQVITIDSINEEIVWLLCLYFSGDERFELEGYSLNKGICLFGGVGVGKTTLMSKFFQNQRQSYMIKMCRAVEDEFAIRGDIVLREYGVRKQTPYDDRDPYGHKTIGHCFDDLGTEPQSKYYGKNVEVLAEILLNRYDNELLSASTNNVAACFNHTHITTNLSTDEIFDRYGSRVSDRMQEMFNMIAFPNDAKSRRK